MLRIKPKLLIRMAGDLWKAPQFLLLLYFSFFNHFIETEFTYCIIQLFKYTIQ